MLSHGGAKPAAMPSHAGAKPAAMPSHAESRANRYAEPRRTPNPAKRLSRASDRGDGSADIAMRFSAFFLGARFFWARGRTALFWASIEMKSDSCAWGSGCVRAKRPSDSAYPNRRRPITGRKTNGAGSDRLRAFEAHFVPRSRADAQAPHTTGSVGAHKQAWPPLSPKSGGGDCV